MQTRNPAHFASQSSFSIRDLPVRCGGAFPWLLLSYGLLLTAGCKREPSLLLKGSVVDSATGQPIAGAVIMDYGYDPTPGQGSQTDSQGRYALYTRPEEHKMIARTPGYPPQIKPLLTRIFQRNTERVEVMEARNQES